MTCPADYTYPEGQCEHRFPTLYDTEAQTGAPRRTFHPSAPCPDRVKRIAFVENAIWRGVPLRKESLW